MDHEDAAAHVENLDVEQSTDVEQPDSDEQVAPDIAVPVGMEPADAASAILRTVVEAKNGSHRQGQEDMARFVAMSLSSQRPLLVEGGTGIGKALDVDTPIPTPRGFIRMGALKVGDLVFNELGQIVAVTHAFKVLHDRRCYEVTFSDGSIIVADGEHLWDTLTRTARRSGGADDWDASRTVTTEQIANTLRHGSHSNHAIPMTQPLETASASDLPVSPYSLGVWLAGTTRAAVGASALAESVPEKVKGLKVVKEGKQVTIQPTPTTLTHLEALGVTQGKAHVPDSYLFSSRTQRENLLAGLLDVSGYVVGGERNTGGQVQFTDARQRLAADVQSLVASLGFRPTLRPRLDAEGRVVTWIVAFSPSRPVFRSEAKNERLGTPATRRTHLRSITSVKEVTSRPVRCISVSGQRSLYLAGRTMIPTHNSIGYLSGALASGKQVIVAPHTKALQDQLRDDLDLIVSAFPADGGEILDGPPSYAVIKGRKAYLCLSKVKGRKGEGGSEGEEPLEGLEILEDEAPAQASELGGEFIALSKWADQTSTGDRSDVPFPVSSKAWDLASVSAEECTAKACPFYKDKSCFAEKARNRGRYANIVVVNQSYLAMGMKIEKLLPETVGGVVVDEAHEFPSVVADTFGAQLGPDRVRNALRKMSKPLLEYDAARAEPILKEIEREAERLYRVMPAPERSDRDLISSPKVVKVLEALHRHLSVALDFACLLPETTEVLKARKDTLTRMIDNLVADLSILLMGSTDTQVAWVETQRGKAVARSARFDVAQTINDLLIRRFKGVTLTSATLTLAGSFEQTARHFGMDFAQQDALDEGRVKAPAPGQQPQRIWGASQVRSPFNYPEQAMLYLPPDMPQPGSGKDAARTYYEAVATVAEQAIRAAGGRTLVLCTSRESVRVITEQLQSSLGHEFPVYSQEPGEPAKEVARKFADDPRSVLVGTRTFWTGVSVEGDTCAAVILDKLPFPSPGEPIIAARSEKADKREAWAGFREVFLAEACLTAVQGAGRLVRTVKDRGVVIICDPRINPSSQFKKSYGRDLLKSLPEFHRARSGEEVWDFLRSINATANDSEQHQVEVDDAPSDEE